MPVRRACYFLGNDHVYDWCITFLESFRAYNPDLTLLLLPYDDRCDKLLQKSELYQFTLAQCAHQELIDQYAQKITRDFDPTFPNVPMYRKLWLFFADVDSILYCDADIAVCEEMTHLFETFENADADFAYFGVNKNYSFTEEFESQAEPPLHTYNAGHYFLRPGTISIDDFDAIDRQLRNSGPILKPRFGDQAFLNYLSYFKKFSMLDLTAVDSDLASSTWADPDKKIQCREGVFRVRNPNRADHGKRMPLIHWNGFYGDPVMPYWNIFWQFRTKRLGLGEKLRFWAKAWWRYLKSPRFAQPVKKAIRKVIPKKEPTV